MGCDIHAYIEHKGQEDRFWWNFGSRIHLSRDYGLFGALAGVRDDRVEHIEPRGVPRDISFGTKYDFTYFVSDSLEDDEHEDGAVSRAAAERYAKYSGWWDDKHVYVNHPDWHTPSWLTLAELKVAYARYREYYKKYDYPALELARSEAREKCDHEIYRKAIATVPMLPVGPHIDTEAVIAAMESLEKNGHETRLVFWFDN